MNMHSTIATAGLCAGLLAFSSLPASAAWRLNGTTLTDGTNWNLKVQVSGNNLTVTGRNSGSGALDFSDVETDTADVETDTKGYKVVGIDNQAFSGNKTITSLRAPDVESITYKVFNGCSNLKCELDLPKLTTLGNIAFQSSGITFVHAPLLETIETSAFNSCSSLTNAVFGSVVTVKETAFYGCKALTNVTFGASLRSLGNQAFKGAAALKSIQPERLPELVSIGESCFTGLSNFRGDLDFPKLTTMGTSTFNGTKITSFRAPRLVGLPNNTFISCGSLSKVTIYGGGALGSSCMEKIAGMAVIEFMGPAPSSLGYQALKLSDINKRYQIHVMRGANLESWNGNYSALPDSARSRSDYPSGNLGKRTKGLVQGTSYLVDADFTKATILSVR